MLSKLRNDEMYYGEFGQQWLSNSDISTLLNNPLMFRKGKSDSKAMLMGRYFHWAILEPEKAKEIRCIDATTRSTKLYKDATRDGNMALLCHEQDQVDRMVDAIMTEEEAETERTVIISERGMYENQPTFLLREELTSAAFRVHPYHHEVIGDKIDLETMTRDDLYNHYRRYYAPNNATIVVVGDFKTDEMLAKIEDMFGNLPGGVDGFENSGSVGRNRDSHQRRWPSGQ